MSSLEKQRQPINHFENFSEEGEKFRSVKEGNYLFPRGKEGKSLFPRVEGEIIYFPE
jgi:hypothetical protein